MKTEISNQIEIISTMVKQYPNDQDLGKEYRKFILATDGKLDDFCRTYPNDFDLGKFLRKKIKN